MARLIFLAALWKDRGFVTHPVDADGACIGVEVLVDSPEESFSSYVRARLAALSRIAYLLTGDAHLAEDLVQQCLAQVATRWQQIAAAGDPEPYVRKVLYRQHISWWRRWRHDAVPSAQLPEQVVPDSTDMVAAAVAVRAALAQLAPKQRAVLVLRFYEDLSEAQTAEVLGCSVSTVKSQTRDALSRMRTIDPELAEVVR